MAFPTAKLALHSLLMVAFLACSGCVVGRRSIELEVPSAAKIVNASKGTVSIASVVDKRQFENKPSDPSIPSIDGDVNSMGAAERNKMIGRQRNTWGKAMGDVALAEGQTVESRTRQLVTEAFQRRGYTVTDAKSKNRADIVIDKFWAWFTPGMFVIDFEANLRADMNVSLNGRTSKFTVTGYGKKGGGMASDEHWRDAYSSAFEDFLKNLDAVLGSLEEDTGLGLSP
ncbi:hypothetical protein [Steroidobacter sp.]|uniref:hypothetical protein n=1 Tax=Steroidobacter sp. TaxID=1978227 RepID=UPI001A3A54A9|nr:hypothetical protein [Steroidobacter sp.]MBL8266945.1 hypothetical protein [Steroidobacter sp.]